MGMLVQPAASPAHHYAENPLFAPARPPRSGITNPNVTRRAFHTSLEHLQAKDSDSSDNESSPALRLRSDSSQTPPANATAADLQMSLLGYRKV